MKPKIYEFPKSNYVRVSKALLMAFFVFAFGQTHAQTEKAWSAVVEKNFKTSKNTDRLSFPTDFKMFRLEVNIIRQALANAPERFGGENRGAIILLPNAEGKLERFEVFEASNFEPALQARYPQIRSYVGRGIDDKRAILRLSDDLSGIQTTVFRTDKRNEFMEPYSEDGNVYAIFNSSRNKGQLPFTCSTEDLTLAHSLQTQATQAGRLSNSGELLTFRLALSCNGEYAAYHGGTVAGALAAFNATMTRVNGVFEKDLAIRMTIIANTNLVIYTNAATDPYTSMFQWNNQLQTTLTNVIGNANYDIGHLFGGSGGGGNAGCIGCVCVANIKGRGITSPADGVPMGDNFDIDYVAHEMGHQFGANHTFSNNVEGSGVNVEPGSGSTIMGYAGITNQDIANHSDDYFVFASIKQIQDNMVGKTCPVRTTLSNAAPVMDAGRDYIIPKSTPFILTGSATDANNDPIAYCWEQNDSATSQTGSASQASATKTGGPNWRSYDPTSSPSRYCPPLARVVANQLTTTFGGIRSEAVSSVARDLNFVLTGRDNLLGVGQTNTDAMKVTVNAIAGPFVVNTPNTAVSWEAGSNQTVIWAVAGTTANGIDTPLVDIYLSTNAGLSFPTLLASAVPNDGSETVTMPNTPGSANRIMVKGHDHIFYDVSNANFTIAAPTPSFSIAFSGIEGEQNKSACQGTAVTYNIPYTALAGFSAPTTFSATGQPAGSTVSFTPSSTSAEGTITMTIDNTDTAAAGFYPITVTGTSGSIVKTVPLYFELFNASFAGAILSEPSDAATAVSVTPTLVWAPDSNASLYEVQIASDESFNDVIAWATVSQNSYTAPMLSESSTYYWRVMPKNNACAGDFTAAFSFQTGQIVCDEFGSGNVPVVIPASGASSVLSTLQISDPSIVSGLTVTLNIQHSWVNDISARLISPAGTEVMLFSNPCSSAPIQNIQATYSDLGSPVVCATNPAISGTVLALSPLAAFNGEGTAGTWTLRVDDAYNQDGGAIAGWSLNICTTQPMGVAENGISNFAVYPNPNNGSFNVRFNSDSGKVIVSVHDIRGRKIFTKDFAQNGVFNETLQLNNAQAGVYLVSVENGSRKEVRKIVIQ